MMLRQAFRLPGRFTGSTSKSLLEFVGCQTLKVLKAHVWWEVGGKFSSFAASQL